jgi:hypothetical protein
MAHHSDRDPDCDRRIHLVACRVLPQGQEREIGTITPREDRILRKSNLAVVVAAASVILAGTGSAAFAAQSTSNADAILIASVHDRLQGFGVSAEVQDKLITKLLSGETLDADAGAQPVSSESITLNGIEKTRNVYADGSVAIGTIEVPVVADPAKITTKSITECTHRIDSFGTNIFTGCTIAWDATTWSVSWTADFDYNVNGEAITSARSVHFGGVGDFAQAGTEIVVTRADKNGTAIADGYVNQKITIAGVGATRRVGVRLQVATRWTDRKSKESPFST